MVHTCFLIANYGKKKKILYLTNVSREARRNIVVPLVSSEVGLSAVNFKGKYPKKGQLTSVKATFWCTGVARQAEWKDYINPACNKNAGEGMLK
jgi:hypothetical protein